LAEGNGPDMVHSAGAAVPEPSIGPHPAGAVFISYASQDASASACIAGALLAAGIEVWFDQSELRGGDVWDQSIRKQIKTCALFLAVISRNTHDRDEGYFRLEWKLAVDRCHLMAADKAFLLPVVIDETRDDDERVPERFREVQWTRLPGGATPAAFVERVRRLLSGELSQGPTRTASQAARVSAAPPIRQHILASWRSKAALLMTIAVVLVAFGYLAANRLALSKRIAAAAVPPGPAAQNAPVTAFNPPPNSIAVLPFTNLSGDPKQEYFSDGMTEELINALSNIAALQVIARTSSFSFKGQNIDIATIARKLNVASILEGSIRRSGNTVRITAQLINTANGIHLWSEEYDRDQKSALVLQTDVATTVARKLQVKLLGDEASKIEVGGTHNVQAHDAYLRGLQIISAAGWEGAYREALTAADQAIAFDPNYAKAYVIRTRALYDLSVYGSTGVEVARKLRASARESAERAVAIAPELADAHIALGWFARAGALDFAGAEPEMERALALSPGNAFVQTYYASFQSFLGHHEQALAAARRAVTLDPQGYRYRVRLAEDLYYARRFDDAIVATQSATTLNPDGHEAEFFRAFSYLGLGKIELARQLCELSTTPMDVEDRLECLAIVYHALGNTKAAESKLDELKVRDADSGCWFYALIYSQWGDKQSALRWLATAARLRDPGLAQIKNDWLFDPIRSEPEFNEIESRMNFPP
jgi:TolB-like protein/Tfp pilus assembly protein PilF